MKAINLICTLVLLSFPLGQPLAQDVPAPALTLTAFESEAELTAFIRRPVPPSLQADCPDSLVETFETTQVPLSNHVAAGDSSIVIRGTVMDDLHCHLGGALVAISGTNVGTVTEGNGTFEVVLDDLNLVGDRITLRARFVGYEHLELDFETVPGTLITTQLILTPDLFGLSEVVVEGHTANVAGVATESITNVQHADTDEGGIVKVHGDYLVVLRRGRLFTVRIGDGALEPVAAVDAFGPDINPRRTWYDEMLVADGFIIVIGFSYSRGGTELGLFRIDAEGGLHYHSTYQIRSNDYYSSRNYATRLIDGKLVLYIPVSTSRALALRQPLSILPSMRRWDDGESEFQPITSLTRLFRPERELRTRRSPTVHSVYTCAITDGGLDCEATAVLGPWSHTFYVSPRAVYVWLSEWPSADSLRAPGMVYRMPLDGSPPSAIGVSGSPVDQFSFLESEDNHLNILVQSRARGQWMWGEEGTTGEAHLLRIPLSAFGDGSMDADPSRYQKLPVPRGYHFQNRFVGEHLLYGTGSTRTPGRAAHMRRLFVVEWQSGDVAEVLLAHGVDRIERLGNGAVVIGSDASDLHFTALQLEQRPRIMSRHTLPNAQQGELRSHGFFYRPDDERSGVLGLPVRDSPSWRYASLMEGSASILFLQNRDLRFTELGELRARSSVNVTDNCQASCMDWYGNARPIFLQGRIFALLGYEIVEGRLGHEHLYEVRRTSFLPEHEVAQRP